MQQQLAMLKEKLSRLQQTPQNNPLIGSDRRMEGLRSQGKGWDRCVYEFYPCLTAGAIQAFEQTYQIRLPAEYRDFLQVIGAGGAGPFLELRPLEHTVKTPGSSPTPRRTPTLIAQPFPWTTRQSLLDQAWTGLDRDTRSFSKLWLELSSHEGDDLEEFAGKTDEWREALEQQSDGRGVLVLSGTDDVSFILVVAGREYGHVWLDHPYTGLYPIPNLRGWHPQADWLTALYDVVFSAPENVERCHFLTWYESWVASELVRLHLGP